MNVKDEECALTFVRKSDPKPLGRPRGRWENGIYRGLKNEGERL
jgi:hypothetical protein